METIKENKVLILIILEVTLWGDFHYSVVLLIPSLNPYYTGSYSMSPKKEGQAGFEGVLILIILEVTLWVNGRFTNSRRKEVLILIILEVTLWECIDDVQDEITAS